MNLNTLRKDGLLIELLITKKCNMSCVHCMYECGPQCSADYMSNDTLEKVKRQVTFLDSVRSSSTINLIGGEPTINLNEFERIFNKVFEWNTNITISTNAWWLSSEKTTKRFFDIVSKIIPGTGESISKNTGRRFAVRLSNDPYHYIQREIKDLDAALVIALEHNKNIPVPADKDPWIFAQPLHEKRWVVMPNGRGRNVSPLWEWEDQNFCFHAKGGGIEHVHYEPNGEVSDGCGYGSIYDFGTADDNILYIIEMIRKYKRYRKDCGRVYNCYNCRKMVQEWKKEYFESAKTEYLGMNTFDVKSFLTENKNQRRRLLFAKKKIKGNSYLGVLEHTVV